MKEKHVRRHENVGIGITMTCSWRAGGASVVAYPGAAKYSCLAALDSRRISLLIERHNGARSSFDIGESQSLRLERRAL